MTTYVLFQPSPVAAFSFSATLDLQTVNCAVPWSLFGFRWYLSLTDTSGNLLVYRSLVGSRDGVANKSISWSFDGRITVETAQPHGYAFMETIDLTLSGVAPIVLNGIWEAFITSPTTYQFNLPTDPGTITAFGRTDYNINLVENYFSFSTLVFRESTKNFEISP